MKGEATPLYAGREPQGQVGRSLSIEGTEWGATPGLRSLWSRNKLSDAILEARLRQGVNGREDEHVGGATSSYSSLEVDDLSNASDEQGGGEKRVLYPSWQSHASSALKGTPGVLIAVILNLFLSLSFGSAFFPASWDFPADVPRTIGIQMFFFSTIVCQVVMTALSEFKCSMGMMMVENISFMHSIALTAIGKQGMGREALASSFVAFAISTLVVGIAFLVCGKLKLGQVVNAFPKNIIVGCIGGIGVFIFMTGLEVATSEPFSFKTIGDRNIAPKWISALLLQLLLRLVMSLRHLPLLPPFYFMAIVPAFYIVLLFLGIPLTEAHERGWFFPLSHSPSPTLLWELLDFSKVDWGVVARCTPTIIASAIFAFMHVPMNIPSLRLSTGQEIDMDTELLAHGWANLISGALGGLQCYLCYSNSVLYYRCNGEGKVSGYLIAAITGIFFVYGPGLVCLIPRCMPGCLLLHVGIDLTKEALWDSLGGFDLFEYASILALTVVMTAWGMTRGLLLGVILAGLTFVLQTFTYVHPIRRVIRATSLRSSRLRTVQSSNSLESKLRNVLVVTLHGQLFFANANTLMKQLESILQAETHSSVLGTRIVVLDFTLVLGIDSSAAGTIADLAKVAQKYDFRVAYVRGSDRGFPCQASLSDRLKKQIEVLSVKSGEVLRTVSSRGSASGGLAASIERDHPRGLAADNLSAALYVADDLDEAIYWCEEVLLVQTSLSTSLEDQAKHLSNEQLLQLTPPHLKQLQLLCLEEKESNTLDRLLGYFSNQTVASGEVLWRRGEPSDSAVLLVSGALRSLVYDDSVSFDNRAASAMTQEIRVGHLVGEHSLLNNINRQSNLIAGADSALLVLSRESYLRMREEEPALAIVLSKICMQYMIKRITHVSNFYLESKAQPV